MLTGIPFAIAVRTRRHGVVRLVRGGAGRRVDLREGKEGAGRGAVGRSRLSTVGSIVGRPGHWWKAGFRACAASHSRWVCSRNPILGAATECKERTTIESFAPSFCLLGPISRFGIFAHHEHNTPY